MTSSRLRLCLLIALLFSSLLPHARPAQAAPLPPSASAAPIVAATPPKATAVAAPRTSAAAHALQAAGSGPALTLRQSVSQEPLLGGSIGYTLVVSNTGVTPVVDRGYNLTIAAAPISGGPAFGDLDGDGVPEVVAGSDDAHLYAWHVDGTPVVGWPKAAGLAVKGVPVVASLRGSGMPQVIVGDFAGTLYLVDRTKHLYLPLIRR